ncbi:MAG: hypothetical protein M1117_00770 [Candidatus Thermoplasmatota archaeon]|nr:hypothetical protein [Candidatus Thermoplasmatota archaeon]
MEEEYRKRPVAWIAALIVVAVVFFTGGYVAHSPPPSSSSKITVTFYESLAPSESSYFQTVLIPQFEKAYPGISVQFV